MNAVEFETTMTQGGEILLPAELAGNIPAGEQLRVVVMWEASSAGTAWRQAGRRRFEEAYCAADAVYEALIHDAP